MRPMPDTHSIVEELHAENAEQLLDWLTPHRGGPIWRNVPGQADWVFRGQAEAKWNLAPSALRGGDPWHKFKRWQLNPIAITDAQELMDAEETFVLDFANHCATLGYEIPFDSPFMRDRDQLRASNDPAHFPLSQYRGVWALAQHYGVPTRLLDWTERPLVAAYFAAIDLAKRYHTKDLPKDDERFAVWALNRGFVDGHCGARNPGIVSVSVPKHTNPNLAAQSGVFTLVRFTDGPAAIPPPIDELMRDRDLARIAWETEGVSPLPKLYKLTCPQRDVRALLHYLHLGGLDAASIYHGHASIQLAMEERAYRSIISRDDRINGKVVKRCACCDEW